MGRIMRELAVRNDKVKVGERLNALRAAFPACRIAIFIDLATCNVLAASAMPAMRQEALETLCEEAVRGFGQPSAQSLRSRETAGSTGVLSRVLVLTRESLSVFLRSTVAREEAICLRCDENVAIEALTAEAETLLHLIGKEIEP
jgi:hypothetical protein